MIKIELTEAERDFLLKVVEAGFEALGISTLLTKLREVQPTPPAA